MPAHRTGSTAATTALIAKSPLFACSGDRESRVCRMISGSKYSWMWRNSRLAWITRCMRDAPMSNNFTRSRCHSAFIFNSARTIAKGTIHVVLLSDLYPLIGTCMISGQP
ncbi:hypothetical protein ALC53_07625 [Atta colombica]|uniref:Uncharacterized protein n=1 Tax=Atta colombica TaxID=520822 RepID=A0A195BBC4_9HYME|nr:hypothetical protein ALC53_07625 [Atta colombica]